MIACRFPFWDNLTLNLASKFTNHFAYTLGIKINTNLWGVIVLVDIFYVANIGGDPFQRGGHLCVFSQSFCKLLIFDTQKLIHKNLHIN